MKITISKILLSCLFLVCQIRANDFGVFIPKWKNDHELKQHITKIHKLLTEKRGNNTIIWEINLKVERDWFNNKCQDKEKTHIVNGVIDSELGNWAAAKNEFSAAIQTSPNSSIGYLFHAIASYHCNEISACAASATTFIEMEPNSEFAKLLFVECSLRLEKYLDAYKGINQLCDSDPSNKYYYTRFKEVTFILLSENESLKKIIKQHEREIQILEEKNAKLQYENVALKEKIKSLEERNRHINYSMRNAPLRSSQKSATSIIATIAGLIIPYKPLQILCAAMSLISN